MRSGESSFLVRCVIRLITCGTPMTLAVVQKKVNKSEQYQYIGTLIKEVYNQRVKLQVRLG